MPEVTTGAALSHVGKVRADNQDSGYAGRHLFLVADGMGGHAGGDVASAIATRRIRQADREHDDVETAEADLVDAVLAANRLLSETVVEHPELTGMGTTVSAILRVGDRIALAHIGDSRIYLERGGRLQQISVDHTFVQRLVDSGRITEEEALVHPRRSVLMRVLGDVDSNPEVDSWVLEAEPGDRWLICSDGLSGVVKADEIATVLAEADTPAQAADRLVRASLAGGAPDNVTVVVVDTDRPGDPGRDAGDGILVGSASSPLDFDHGTERSRTTRIPTLRLTPRPAPEAHFEPQTQDYLAELIEEDARRVARRRVLWIGAVVVLVLAIVLAALGGWAITQQHYYVGVASDGDVAIYQGVQQSLGPVRLSHVVQETDTPARSLSSYEEQQVEETIDASSLSDARDIIRELTRDQR